MIFLVQQIVRKSLWVYDITAYQGWVSVETGQDTAQFALQTIRQLRVRMGGGGRIANPESRELLITADEGGSNGSRCRLWKLELQKFADMGASKFNSMSSPPPGTSME